MLTTVFTLLVVYQIKHFVADYPLQTPYMLGKFKGGTHWIKPLAAHAGVHAALTWLIGNLAHIWLPNLRFKTVAFVTVLDFVAHFVMDRIKASPDMLGRYKALSAKEYPDVARGAELPVNGVQTVNLHPAHAEMCRKQLRDNKLFWWALGADQMVHHLTHYLIIYLLVVSAY